MIKGRYINDAAAELNRHRPQRMEPEKLVEALRTCSTIGGCPQGGCPFYGVDCGNRMKREAADLIEELLEAVKP